MTNALNRTLRMPVAQREKLSTDQVKNNAGSYVFEISPVEQLRRFLILGTDGGTYYQSEHAITREGIALVKACAETMTPMEFVPEIVNAAANAPKRTYAIFAYAVALSTENTKTVASGMDPHLVLKTGTDFFELISYLEQLRGWGAVAKRVVQRVLIETDVEKLGLWSVKYRDRHGWTWKDALRIGHPKSRDDSDPRRAKLFDFMLNKSPLATGILPVDGYLSALGLTNEQVIIGLVEKFGLPWEALADEQRTDAVWKVCVQFIGNTAVLRNLASFTRRGMDKDLEFVSAVQNRVTSSRNLHPITLLNALKTYSSGGSVGRSKAEPYTPNARWEASIEEALETSFTNGVETTGKSMYVALDVSGSMGLPVSGSAVLTCAEVTAAIALATAKNERNYFIRGFSDGSGSRGAYGRSGLLDLGINHKTSFKDAMERTLRSDFAGTDCALPMLHAIAENLEVDTFIVITDNETHSGQVHPSAALKQYRQKSGRNAKLAVVALTATKFSIADPKDPGMMDFVGFSSDLPQALAAFSRM